MLDFLRTNEQGAVVRRSVFPGQKSVSGSSAGGCLNVMTMEGATLSGQFVNVRGFYVVCPEGIQFRAQVIHANQEHVGLTLESKTTEARYKAQKRKDWNKRLEKGWKHRTRKGRIAKVFNPRRRSVAKKVSLRA